MKLETVSNGAPVMSLFIHGGSALTTSVPRDTYLVKHASGKSWCGERGLFGAETATEKGTKYATFDEEHEYTLRLIPQAAGNFPTSRIARRDF